MPATKLDHINIRTMQPEATRDFFVDIVGLRNGERPPFNFNGYWLYAGEQAVIHLTDARDAGAHGMAEGRAGAAIDHVSFRMTGYNALCALLKERKLPFQTRVVPRNGDVQIFVDDPNGVTVELTFLGAEVNGDGRQPIAERSLA
ncbi:MAG TPA: VOC family protein [Candidatus Baltobacteraceae bacterium]|jgi:catechol 2,3-dioxygenase-like lactoylglutathione lyase family enzyme